MRGADQVEGGNMRLGAAEGGDVGHFDEQEFQADAGGDGWMGRRDDVGFLKRQCGSGGRGCRAGLRRQCPRRLQRRTDDGAVLAL